MVIVIHVTIHRDVVSTTSGSVFNHGQLSMGHLILGGPDQVISVTVLHDSMTREQVKKVSRAWIEEQTPTQEAGNVGLINSLSIHSSITRLGWSNIVTYLSVLNLSIFFKLSRCFTLG